MKKILKKAGPVLCITVLFVVCAVLLQGNPAYAKVKLNKKTVYMAPGDTVQLKVTGTKKKAKWSSSDTSVAAVSKKGKVKAKDIGTATITAKVGKKKYKCKVIVEEKSVNRARKLRSYVIKKGKYKKSKKSYELIWKYNDGSNNFTNASITAYKDNYNLKFYYHSDEESGYSADTNITIDLISGEETVRTGDLITYRDDDVDDPFDETTVYGQITTAFDGKGNGLTLNKVAWTSEGEDSTEVYKESTEEDVLATHRETVVNRLNAAFARWDKMFSKKYPALKKAGVSMKSIGFGDWIQ